MISKVLKHQRLFASVRHFAAPAQHSRIPAQKEYYSILGVANTATPE